MPVATPTADCCCPSCGLRVRFGRTAYAGRQFVCSDCGTEAVLCSDGQLAEVLVEPPSQSRVGPLIVTLAILVTGVTTMTVATGPRSEVRPQPVAEAIPAQPRTIAKPDVEPANPGVPTASPSPEQSADERPIEVLLAADIEPAAQLVAVAADQPPAVDASFFRPLLVPMAADRTQVTRRRLAQPLGTVDQPRPVPVRAMLLELEEILGCRIHFEPVESELSDRTVQVRSLSVTAGRLLERVLEPTGCDWAIRWDGSIRLTPGQQG